MIYIVYLTYCTKSSKIYIGVHQTKDSKVFDGYLGNGVRINVPCSYKKATTPFKKAVLKYGVEAFHRITLAAYKCRKEAYALEAAIVTEAFLKSGISYNIKLGGAGGCPEVLKKKVYMYDSNGTFVKEFNTLKECMDEIDPKAHNQSHISRAIKTGTRVRNFQFSYTKVPCMKRWKILENSEKRSQAMLNRITQKVGRYDDAGTLLEVFETSGAAQKAGYKNVQQVLQGRRQHVKGFVFKYIIDHDIVWSLLKSKVNAHVTKYTSNYEKLRGWISEIRCDIDASSRYLALEDSFVKVTKEDPTGNKNYLFKMPGMKKVLLDNFYEAKNNQLMWGKSTMDDNGKCTLHDRQGRELIAGDGLMAQIMRYANKYSYSKLSANVLTEAMTTLAEKCEESVGNTFTFICNDILFRDLQKTLALFMSQHKADQQYLYSQFEQKYVKVGATYGAFEFAGEISIAPFN